MKTKVMYIDGVVVDVPITKGKGKEGQNCNRTACQAKGAYFFNKSTRAWYCRRCAEMIEASAVSYDKKGNTEILFDGLGITKENAWRFGGR
jgi:hypothetical protein